MLLGKGLPLTVRILVNALTARLGGGQTYIRNLLQNVPADLDLDIRVLASPSLQLNRLSDGVSLVTAPDLDHPIKRAIWEMAHLNRMFSELDIDLYFSPGGLLFKGICPSVKTAVTFQNMLPFAHDLRRRYPLGYRRLRDWLLERGFRFSMQRADLTVFISQYAKSFIEEKISFPKSSCRVVIPHGLDDMFRYQPEHTLLRPSWSSDEPLPGEPYILYVSFIDHYKNQVEVVQGFEMYRQQGGDGTLVLVGSEYAPYGDLLRKEIVSLGLQDTVILAGNIPHQDLPALYQHARWNVFASECENCPNILMESLASGRPVICSRSDPMPEFAGDAVAYFDARRPETLAAAMVDFRNHPDMAKAYADQALNNMQAYQWKNTAAKTWNAIYKTALEI